VPLTLGAHILALVLYVQRRVQRVEVASTGRG